MTVWKNINDNSGIVVRGRVQSNDSKSFYEMTYNITQLRNAYMCRVGDWK